MAYGHAERNLALIRQLEAETEDLLGTLKELDPEQSAWWQDHHSPGQDTVSSRPGRRYPLILNAPAAGLAVKYAAPEEPGKRVIARRSKLAFSGSAEQLADTRDDLVAVKLDVGHELFVR